MGMADENRAGLSLNSLDLVGEDGTSALYSIHALDAANGTDWGNPTPAFKVVESLIADGELTTLDRFGNRDVSVGICLRGHDARALALAEADLEKACRPGALIYTPPDGWGPRTVFDVLAAWTEYKFDDIPEVQGERRLGLRLTCLPHARSEHPVVTTLGWEPPVFTTLDPCEAVGSWVRRGADGVGDDEPAWHPVDVAVHPSGTDTGVRLRQTDIDTTGIWNRFDFLERPFASLGAESYFAIDLVVPVGSPGEDWVEVFWNNTPLDLVSSDLSPAGHPYIRYFFETPSGAGTLSVRVRLINEAPFHWYVGGVYAASAIGDKPGFKVKGTRRTFGSLVVAAKPDSFYDDVFIYSDPTMLTHGWSPLVVFGSVENAPAGTYVLYSPTPFGLAGDVAEVGVRRADGSGFQKVSTRVRSATGQRRVPLGLITLGAQRNGRVGDLEWRTADNTGPADPPHFMFRVADDTCLINGPGGNGYYIVDSPSPRFPKGAVWFQDAVAGVEPLGPPDGTPPRDATDTLATWGNLVLTPGMNALFIQRDSDLDSDFPAQVEYYPRWAHHAAE